MDEENTKQLILAAQAGERNAFEELLQENYELMYRIAFKWCGNKENAEDITQDACIKLAHSIGSFRFHSKFSTWLYRLVINTAKDWFKSNNRHKGESLHETGKVGASQATAEDSLYAHEVLDHVRALPDKEKDAVLLVCGQGMTHAEAAEVMDVKESTVSWYIHEARKKLEKFKDKERRHG